MKNILSLVRPNIKKLKPYISARSLCLESGLIMLDANENPYGDGVKNCYPDPFQNKLREELAQRNSLDSNQILFGNGSDELIDMLIRVFCEPNGDSILICPPTFGFYEVSAQINDVGVIKVLLTPEYELDVGNILKINSKILFLPNPNAPTGNIFKKENLEIILKNFQGVVVLDEAYVDFSSQPSWTSRLDEFSNLVVLQTFSKYWGLAGCRIGMVFGGAEIIETLSKIKPPYNLNNLSAQEAFQSLQKGKDIEKNAQIIRLERDNLWTELERFSFITKVDPSETNFLWVKSSQVKKVCEFLKQAGILVREYSEEPNFFRISIGIPADNQKLISTLKQFKS